MTDLRKNPPQKSRWRSIGAEQGSAVVSKKFFPKMAPSGAAPGAVPP